MVSCEKKLLLDLFLKEGSKRNEIIFDHKFGEIPNQYACTISEKYAAAEASRTNAEMAARVQVAQCFQLKPKKSNFFSLTNFEMV